MGDDKRSDLTLRFLNLILNRTEENAFKKVEFLNPEQLKVLLMNEPLLQKAVSFERAFLNDDKMYREYQQREDAIREETTKFNRVKREAKAEEKLETAIKFLKLGVDVNTVASGTGLSLDKVIEINRQLNK